MPKHTRRAADTSFRAAQARLRLESLEDRTAPAGFTNGNLVIYRVGDGVAELTNTGSAVFLDEYTPDGTFVQSLAMPTTASGNNNALFASNDSTEGLMTLSVNAQYLLLTGYSATVASGSLPGSGANGGVPRVVGRVDAAGNIDTSTALTTFADGASPRGAASTDGTSIWVTSATGGSGTGGVHYTTLGSSTSTQLATTPTNLRGVAIFGGQLYVSTFSGNSVQVGKVGTGTPTTGGQTITSLPGFPTTGSRYAFFFADLSAGVAGLDTLYVADDGASGGIQKFSLVGGLWTANGTITATAVRGLTGVVSGGNVILYGTTGSGPGDADGGGSIYAFTDTTGYNATVSGSATTIATAGANTAFRGVAFAPNAAPVLSGASNFDDIGVNETDNAGTLVSALISGRVTDGNANARSGIAVTAVNTASGSWEYTTNGGANWLAVGSVSDASALLLAADANTRLRFVPNADFIGTVSPGVTFRAWDQTSGTAGTKVNVSTSGAGTAFSAATASAGITVSAQLTPSVTDSTTNEDTQTTSGLVIMANAGDNGATTHFKITNITGGTLFQNDGTTPVSEGAFITAAQGAAGLRFTPNANLNDSTTSFFGFDVQASTSADDAGLGGDVATATVNVTAVNDAPTFDLAAAGVTVEEDGGLFSQTGFAFDIAPGPATATDESTQTLNFTVTNDNSTLFAVQPDIHEATGTLSFTLAPGAFGNATVLVTLTDSGSGVAPSVNSFSRQFTITASPAPDAPGVTSATTNEDTQTASGLVISRNPADGTEVTHFKITNIAGGTLFLNDGTTPISEGAFITFAQGNAGLKFTPDAEQNDDTTAFFGFEVQASLGDSDAGLGGDAVTATVTVNPVNDQPSAELSSSSITVGHNSGPFSQSNFATFAPGGGSDEATQAPTYTLTNTNGALFAVQPAIDTSGTLTFTPAPGAGGTATITVVVRDGGGTLNGGIDAGESRQFTITVNAAPPVAQPSEPVAPINPGASSQFIAVGSDVGEVARVRVLDARTGDLVRAFAPFDSHAGGVRVAIGDVNGDGIDDVIVATATGASHVKVFDVSTGAEVMSFLAFDGSPGGLSLAAGDLNGDRRADIVVGTATGSSHVIAFSGLDGAVLHSFFAFPGFAGGVRVAADDVNGDGRADIAAVAGPGGSGHVKVFDGVTGGEVVSFLGYDGYAGEINLAAGDLTGDGKAEVITAARNANSGAHVKAFTPEAEVVRSFFAPTSIGATFGFQRTEGVAVVAHQAPRVAAADVTGDRIADILLGDPPGTGVSKLQVLDGATGRIIQNTPAFDDLFAFGVFVDV